MSKIKVKDKVCANPCCANTFTPFKSTDKYCKPKCYYDSVKVPEKPRKAVKKVSDKRLEENKEYKKLRLKFLSLPENQICFIDGCNQQANTIEHLKGRWGRNYLDTTTWAACCLEHNLELENNPELSKKYQLSKIHGNKKT